jgi:NTP pyrophosphatase (non-canonical NTP hydrolase)
VTQPIPPFHDGLTFLIAQATADSSRWFPKNQDLAFTTLAMAGEVGEVANLVKKVVRGSITVEDAMDQGLAEEVVDVLIYLVNLMGNPAFLDVNWMEVWHSKREFNARRFDKAPKGTDDE